VVGRDRLAHGHSWLELFNWDRHFIGLQRTQGTVNISDKLGQIGNGYGIVADIGRDDFGAEFDQVALITGRRAGGLVHVSTFHSFYWTEDKGSRRLGTFVRLFLVLRNQIWSD